MQKRNRESVMPDVASAPTLTVTDVSTPTLLNEAYTRLRVAARAYEHACGEALLSPIHTWMESYGRRLTALADALQDEGARIVKRFDLAAPDVFDEEMCSSPRTLLAEAEVLQGRILACFEAMTERLDMDAELYDLLTEDYDELGEGLQDITELRREYDAYLAGER